MRGKRIKAFGLAVLIALLSLSGCADSKAASTVYEDKEFGFQTELPEVGEEVAVIHTNMGDISVRFFPEAAPKAVENFKTLAQSGYYDGVIFHRVISDFMIQTGDPTGTGTGGESCWGGTFEDEFDSKLGNLRGALSMANGGEDTNGSQFFINQATAEQTATTINYLESYYDSNRDSLSYDSFAAFFASQYSSSSCSLNADALTDEIFSAYKQYGGNLYLDGPLRESGGHTVFGQVYDGMDVVDAIAAVETNSSNMPNELICIESIEWTIYQGE